MQDEDNFRFESLNIWKLACDVGGKLCDLADHLENKRLYRFAEQLRGAALSMSNNIAEGSGSDSSAEFKNFFNYARRSVYENASMIAFYHRRGFIGESEKLRYLEDLATLSKMITAFHRKL